MTRRWVVMSILGLTAAGWAGLVALTARVERLAIDPEAERYAYRDGWIVRK